MQTSEILETSKAVNPLKDLEKYGQSVWLDYIRRTLITSGELKRLIEEDGLKGITSNPSIFEKAITGSTDYSDILSALQGKSDLDAKARYEQLAIRDIQDAADILGPVYKQTKRRDGYVSLEVSPYLARDTKGTLEEARRLWKAVDRPNVMIKVPGTAEGIPAFQQLISEGIKARVVSMPSWDLFEHQDRDYREEVLPPDVTARIAVEQASTFGWSQYVGEKGRVLGMRTFGASAPLKELQKKFGFTPDAVISAARELVGKSR